MPTTKSAKKRLRQSEERRGRNRAVKSVLKSEVRKFRTNVEAKNFTQAEQDFRTVAKKLDQAAAKNVIHRNKASRTKARLQHFLKGTKSGATASA
jgi:small subunit ribosomal protein S20